MKRFFSIIIITLNEEKNIKKILQDLVKQSYKNFEVLVVDSNSTDKTKKVSGKFKNQFSEFKLIEMKERWISLGRNTWWKNAKYNDFIFFDADTRINNDFLEKLDSYLNENPDIWAWSFQLSLKTEKLKYSIWNSIINVANTIMNPIYPTCIWACLYAKKKVFNAVWWFDENISLWEDSAFSVNIHKKGHKFKIIPVPFHFNTRRFEQDWTLKTLWTYLLSGYYLFIKKDTNKKLDYDFWHYKKK